MEQIGHDQLSAVVRAMPAALLCGLANAAIVIASLWTVVPPAPLLAWSAYTVGISLWFCLRRRQHRTREVASLSRRALRKSVLAATLLALPWAMLSTLYLGTLPHTNELMLVTVCAGMAAGGSVLLAPVYPAALAYVAVILVPFAIKCFALSASGYALEGMLTLSYAAFLLAVVATTAGVSVERTRAVRALTESTHLLKQRDAVISMQNTRFETALNNMTQGLCFFDGNERLIVCNQRYVQLYGLDPARVQPGISLGDILDMRREAGTLPPMTKEDYLAWRAKVGGADSGTETAYEMQNGRTYSINYRPMAEGAWVATTDDITDRRRAEAQIAHLATHDALTDLPNRVLFSQRLDEAVRAVRAGDRSVAVLMLDLNKFKQVNDTLGHPVGDDLLRAVAQRLTRCIRSDDTVARLGGDEFAVVLHTLDVGTEAEAIARRVDAALREPFILGENQVQIGTSIGIALASGDTIEAEQLIRQADVALYRAKAEGAGRYRFFEPEMDQRPVVTMVSASRQAMH